MLAIAAIAGLYFENTFTDGDEGRYYFLASAIANGHGQADIHLPEPQLEALTPPGYPAVLAGILTLTGPRLVGLKCFSYLSYLLYGLTCLLLLKRLVPDPKAQLILFLLALFPVTALSYTWASYADTPYLLLYGLTLLACDRVSREKSGLALTCGILVALSMAIRPVGLALIPAVGLHFLSRRFFKGGFWCTLGFTVFYIPVIVFTYKAIGVPFGYISHYESDLSTAGKIAQVFTTIGQILPYYLFEALPRRLFFSLMDGDCLLCILRLSWLIKPLSLTLSLLILGGWILRIRKLHVFDVYFLVYMPMVSTYHVALYRGIEDRYLLPVFIHAAVYLYTSLQWLTRSAPRLRAASLGALAAAACYVVVTACGGGLIRAQQAWALRGLDPFASARHLNHPDPSRQAFGSYIDAAHWLQDHSETNAVVLSRKPRHTYVLCERRGFRLNDVRVPGETPYETLLRQSTYGPTYVLQDAYPLDSSYGRDRIATVDPMLKDHAEAFTLEHETGEPVTRIWRLTLTEPASKSEK